MNVKRSILSGGLAAAVVAAAFALFPSSSTLSPMPALLADSLNCNLSKYKAAQGLAAVVDQDALVVSWSGQNGADLRVRYAIDGGQPVIRISRSRNPAGSGRRSAEPDAGSRRQRHPPDR
jgi:hypothetical protein